MGTLITTITQTNKTMFNELPKVSVETACETIGMAVALQDEAKTILEEVVSTLASGYMNDKAKSQELQRAFYAMSALTRSTEMLNIARLQIQPYFIAKMPCSYPSHYKGHKLGIQSPSP